MIKSSNTIECTQLVSSLDDYLNVGSIKESAINGLQIQGKKIIKHIAVAVSANKRTIDKATELGVDALIVHHGLFWGQKVYPLEGIMRDRISALLKADMNLIAYHLPLDVHAEVGNNAQIARLLELPNASPHRSIKPTGLVYHVDAELSLQECCDRLSKKLGCEVKCYLPHPNYDRIKSLAWCTGAGADFMEQAEVDAFITGEIKEHHFDEARELNCAIIAAGHYATERFGVKALGEMIERQHDLHVSFIEEWSPL